MSVLEAIGSFLNLLGPLEIDLSPISQPASTDPEVRALGREKAVKEEPKELV